MANERGGRGEIRDRRKFEREIERERELKFFSIFFFLHDISPRREEDIFFSPLFLEARARLLRRLFTVHRRGQRGDMERIMQTWTTRDKEFKVMAIEDGRPDKTASTRFAPFL